MPTEKKGSNMNHTPQDLSSNPRSEQSTRNGLESMPPATEVLVSGEFVTVADMTDRQLLEAIYLSQREVESVVMGLLETAKSNPMVAGMLGL